MDTVFSSVCAFLIANKGEIISKVIASAAYDGLKKALNFKSLKERLKKFFKSEDDSEKFIETMCSEHASNAKEPEVDIERCFKKISTNSYSQDVFLEIKNWVEENKERIISVSQITQNNQSGFNIGVQNAGKDIYNIQGDLHKGK